MHQGFELIGIRSSYKIQKETFDALRTYAVMQKRCRLFQQRNHDKLEQQAFGVWLGKMSQQRI